MNGKTWRKTRLGEELFFCHRCGKDTTASHVPCVNCWEVEHRLDLYLQSASARAFVLAKIALADPGGSLLGSLPPLVQLIQVGSSPDGIAAALQRYCDET